MHLRLFLVGVGVRFGRNEGASVLDGVTFGLAPRNGGGLGLEEVNAFVLVNLSLWFSTFDSV